MAGLISPHLLEQIRAANDIVDVIGSYVPLKRAGANFRALCPFHREKTPSFNVNPHHQIFKCFGCGKGGDVFTFVKEYENIEFIDAVRRLAERARIPLEFENNPAAQQARHIKEVLWQIHEQITQRWHMALLNDASGQVARDYLKKRAVSDEAVKLFRLGYAPEQWDDTVNWAKSKSHTLAAVEQAGLIIRKEGTDRYYDRFRGRLIFPICDEQGRVIGFSGRILGSEENTAKYVNSPETPLFSKGKVFFGLDKSKRALLDAQTAIVCEGQLDLISCFMAGVQNIVAPQGTALTGDHARILKRYVEEVVLCFDADKAGQNAAIRALDSLLGAGLAIRVVNVPSGKDPDEFIKEHGAEPFRELIEKAEGFFDFYLKLLCRNNDITSDKGRSAVIRELGEALVKTQNAVLIDTYAQKTALRLGVAPEAARAEFKKLGRASAGRMSASPSRNDSFEASQSIPTAEPPPDGRFDDLPAPDEQPAKPPSLHEMQLLKILLTTPDHVRFAADHLRLEWLEHPVVRRVTERRLLPGEVDGWTSSPVFLAQFSDDPLAQSVISDVLADAAPVPFPDKQLQDILLRLRNDSIDRQLKQLMSKVAHPETLDDERVALLQEQQRLRALRREKLTEKGRD